MFKCFYQPRSNGSAVKSTTCFFRGLDFSSQNLHDNTQPFITSISGYWMPFTVVLRHQVYMAHRYTHRQATHLHKIIIQNSETTSVYVWVDIYLWFVCMCVHNTYMCECEPQCMCKGQRYLVISFYCSLLGSSSGCQAQAARAFRYSNNMTLDICLSSTCSLASLSSGYMLLVLLWVLFTFPHYTFPLVLLLKHISFNFTMFILYMIHVQIQKMCHIEIYVKTYVISEMLVY